MRVPTYRPCGVCGKEFKVDQDKLETAKYCSIECRNTGRRKAVRPSKAVLAEMTRVHGFTETGHKYGVTPTTVKTWCKQYGLPHRKNEIKFYEQEGSDEA